MVTTKYVVMNGYGHYEVSNGIRTVSCDIPEVQEVQRELLEELYDMKII